MVRKTVTLVFCDVTGSTALGEALDPETVRGVISRYFDTARAVLERHGGTVEKFVGDAVMAAFGIPAVHEDDALRAVRAAVELRDELAALNVALERDFGVSLGVRTGVNTGEVIAGDPSLGQDFATGDAVIVAQRLESAAAAGEILLGDATFRLVRDAVDVEPLPPLEVRGRAAPVAAWRVLSVSDVREQLGRLEAPMVGRNAELDRLRSLYEHVQAEGAGRAVTVLGPPGMGKSRLVHELVGEIGADALVLSGRCLPYGKGISFWPVLEIVRQAAEIGELDRLEEARRKIARLLPEEEGRDVICDGLTGLIGLGAAEASAEEAFWAIRRLLETLARKQPVVVILDDVHWGEPTFLDLVEYLAARTTDSPVLLCLLARQDLLELRPAWLAGVHGATALVLRPLSEPASVRMIENLLGGAHLDEPDAAQRIVRVAEGNPLFVEEMLRMLVDEGALVRRGDSWTTAGDLSDLAVPPTIRAVLAARLDRLSREERAVLQRASVVGQVFWWSAVAALSPAAADDAVGRHLQALVHKELIRPSESPLAAEDAFAFGHVLIRDAAYESTAKRERADLHEAFVRWAEARRADGLPEYDEILGYHLEQAYRYRVGLAPPGEHEQELASGAAERLAAAGRRALARRDLPAALNLLERACRLPVLDSSRQAGVFLDLAAAHFESGEFARAGTALEEALSAAADNAHVAAAVRMERAYLQLFNEPQAGSDELLEAAYAAIRSFEHEGDTRGLAAAWCRVAEVHWISCRSAAMEQCLERGLEFAERAGDQRLLFEILSGLARAAVVGPRPVEEGIERCLRLLERASAERGLVARISGMLGVLEAMHGGFDEARELFARSAQIYGDLGLGFPFARQRMYFGWAELLAGDPAAAARELRHACEELERYGERAEFSTAAAFLSRALYAQGLFEEAEALTVSSEAAAAADDVASQMMWRGTRAKILARRGRTDEAERLAREAVKLAESTDLLEFHADALADLSEVLSLAGREDEAVGPLARALELYREKGNTVLAGRADERLAALARLTPAPGSRM